MRGKLRPDSRESMDDLDGPFIVNCGLKVGNSFLYIFSRFLSFTEILDTFDFLCLCFFSLTDLFLCDSETTKQQQGGFLFFQTTRKHF